MIFCETTIIKNPLKILKKRQETFALSARTRLISLKKKQPQVSDIKQLKNKRRQTEKKTS